VEYIFTDEKGMVLPYDQIMYNLLKCEVFAEDPLYKKINLLSSKDSMFVL
jgi:hypothetical protein